MSQAAYKEVVRLVDQLSPEERQSLVEHLQRLAQRVGFEPDEWLARLEQVQVNIPPGPKFSDRREDWYDDDGR